MFKSTKEFDTAIYNMLIKLRDGEKWDENPKGFNPTDHQDALGYIISKGYIFGKNDKEKRISSCGLQFIENFVTPTLM